MKIITRIALTALTLLLVSSYVPGVQIDGVYAAFIAAIVLGILNSIIRPILVILTLPITILSLGLFILIINASLFYFASTFIKGFYVDSFMAAFIGSITVSLISTLSNKWIK